MRNAEILRNRRKLAGYHPGTMAKPKPREWSIYIPNEGHWPIKGKHATEEQARAAYLKWARRKRLPAGAFIIDQAFQ
jgi:hypothetical protein